MHVAVPLTRGLVSKIDVDDARKAYNEAALRLFGEYAWLNKI